MQKLEELKQELIKQKDIIEKKGGKMVVANNNPSPSEITAGINSIISSNIDFSLANAKNEDVKKGKTYYNNLGELQTGNYEDLGYTLFLYNPSQVDSNQEYEFVVPEYLNNMRDSLFFDFPCKLKVTLHPSATKLPYQVLYTEKGEITLQNSSLPAGLTELGDYALAGVRGVDLSNLPNITILGPYCLKDTYYGQKTLKIPSSITTMGVGSFACSAGNSTTIDNLIMENYPLYYVGERMLNNVYLNQSFTFPDVVTGIGERFCEGGGIKQITFPIKVNSIGQRAFYNSADECYTDYVVFLNPKPPSVGSLIFNNSHAKNLKVYVPDNSIADYKKKLIAYDNILPMSELP